MRTYARAHALMRARARACACQRVRAHVRLRVSATHTFQPAGASVGPAPLLAVEGLAGDDGGLRLPLCVDWKIKGMSLSTNLKNAGTPSTFRLADNNLWRGSAEGTHTHTRSRT